MSIHDLNLEKCYPKLASSLELNRGLGKKPNAFEIIIGLACWGTFIVMTGYKLYTGRGICEALL